MTRVNLPEYILTAEDIKALKKSRDLCFFWSEGESFINTAWTQAGVDNELRHKIPATAEFRIYKDSPGYDNQVYSDAIPHSCFAMCGNYDSITTFVHFLKPGDTLRLEWHSSSDGYYKGSKTTVIDKASGSIVANEERLWSDDLYVSVRRGDDKYFKFYIRHSTMPENSAKMIRMRQY